MSATTAQLSTAATAAALSATTNQEQGLEFQVREYDDDVVQSVAPSAAVNLTSDSESEEEEEEPAPLVRQMSSAPPKKPAAPVVPETATAATDSNIKRVDFKDEATTVKILVFLETRGINTNKLVQEHILRHRREEPDVEQAPHQLRDGVYREEPQNRNRPRGCQRQRGNRALQVVRILHDGGYGCPLVFHQ